jgi:parvulin-like peptidyl-prolyl isomerase
MLRFLFSLMLILSGPVAGANAAEIAATVQGMPITVAQLDRELALVIKDRQPSAEQREILQKQVLQHAVDRLLVLHWLGQTNQAASEQDVALELGRLQKKLDAESLKMPDYLKSRGQTLAEFRAQQRWELSWQRYLDRYLTAANLQKYFDKNRRDFDGSELRVAHLLLAAPKTEDPAAWKKLTEQAEAIRESIASGKQTFAAAVKEHSTSPTATSGGDIGWIKRREPMPESFSAAAFALAEGEVSPPVETTFGVHLIQCLEIKAGQGTWQAATEELRPAVIRYLFRWIADKERPAAKIEYTNHWPH